MSRETQVTIQHVLDTLNQVAEDIDDAVIVGDDSGVRDAINLMVNATVYYLEHPDGTDLVSAIRSNYDTRPRTVLGWVGEVNADVDDGPAYQYNDHRNDSGDWCPWSEVEVSEDLADDEDARCPAGCRASAVEEVEDE